jgi:hypothetical protein
MMPLTDSGRNLPAAISTSLDDLLQRPGGRLEPPVRQRMEAAFGADFGGVVVHTGPMADRLCARLGAKAFAFGDHLAFAEGVYAPDRDVGRRVLAHELAHLLQQRRAHAPAATAPVAELEAEADAAAAAVLRGEPFACQLADARGVPACWALVGHYYTPLLMFLNGGCNVDTASRLALWCWLPDQVHETDAAYVAERMIGYNTPWHRSRDLMRDYHSKLFESEFEYVAIIQQGLHVLTGGNAASQTVDCARRFNNFGGEVKMLFRGMALHPYGDCFAHRDLDGEGDLYGKTALIGHTSGWHDPDHVYDKRRVGIYIEYLRGLDDLARRYTRRSSSILPIEDMIAALSPLLDFDMAERDRVLGFAWEKAGAPARGLGGRPKVLDEDLGAEHAMRVANDLFAAGLTEDKSVQMDSVPWDDYYDRNKALIIQDAGGSTHRDDILFRIFMKAANWAKGIPEPVTPFRRSFASPI